jgi:HKD family nuclease
MNRHFNYNKYKKLKYHCITQNYQLVTTIARYSRYVAAVFH